MTVPGKLYKKDEEFEKLLDGTASIGTESNVLASDGWYGPAETARAQWNAGTHADWTGVPYKIGTRQMIEVMILLVR